MSYQQYKGIIHQITPYHVLSDAETSVAYEQLPQLLTELHHHFKEKGEIRCLAFTVRNRVADVLVLLYLLSEQVNFFLISAGSPVQQAIPSFCDKILLLPADTFSLSELADKLDIQPNPDYVPVSSRIPLHAGAVYLASSGTSGPPKYICFRQSQLLQNAKNCIPRFGYHHQAKVLIPVPLGHMYGMGAGVLPALICGASISLVEKNNVLKLFDQLNTFKPDITLITPTVCQMILMLNKPVSHSCTYITAGERIRQQTIQRFTDSYGMLINLYGCTELGAIATSPTEKEKQQERIAGALTPLPHVKVKITEAKTGELHCLHNAGFEYYTDRYGNILADGRTADGWYPTRDLATELSTGYFSVNGRMDNTITRCGFQVSLEDIAMAIENQFDGINQVVAFERNKEGHDELMNPVVAICELVKDATLEETFVKNTCKQYINRHLIPDEFYFVEKLPRLNNGKPDRAYLINNYKSIMQP